MRIKELYNEISEAVDNYRTEIDYSYKKDMKDFLKDMKDMMTSSIFKLKSFINKIKRSTKWFCRTWNNYDWDYIYLIIMIVDKLKDMRYQFDIIDSDNVDLRHQPSEFGESDVVDRLEQLDRVIEIGERLIKDDYTQYTPELNEWFESNDIFDNDTPKEISDKLDIIHKDAEIRRMNDIQEFFNLMRDYHEYWWS